MYRRPAFIFVMLFQAPAVDMKSSVNGASHVIDHEVHLSITQGLQCTTITGTSTQTNSWFCWLQY